MDSNISIENIKQIPFFYDISENDIQTLMTHLKVRELEAFRYVFKEGDDADCMYFVLSGKAKIVKKISPKEEEQITEISPTQVFGEMAFIDRKRRQASVVTMTDFKALKLTVEGFNSLKIQHPQIAINIIRKAAHILGLKLRKSSNNKEGII